MKQATAHLSSRNLQLIVMMCAALGIATFAFLAHAEDSGNCRSAANPSDCWHAQMEQHMQRHEAQLHDALKLSAAQEPAWKTFTDATHQQMAAMEAEHKSEPSHADIDKLSAPDRLQKHISMLQSHATMMQAQLNALKQFYTALTPEQQATMNSEIAKMEKHWHHHGMPADHSHHDPA